MLSLQGRFNIQLIREGKLVFDLNVNNGIVDVGKNTLLDIVFRNQAQVPVWYIGLIDSPSFSTLSNTDTMLIHSGWTEFVGYNDNRQPWAVNPAATRSITTSSSASYTITTNGTLRGMFVASVATKGTDTGILWSTATFAPRDVIGSVDVIKVNYTVDA